MSWWYEPDGENVEFIDLKAQYAAYRHEIDAAMARVLEHGRFIMGPEVAELEAALVRRVGVEHALTTASGTASLEIALRALEIGPGDEVITAPFTWIATAEVIAAVGARPVFVDIDPATFTIDPSLIEAAISPQSRAIIPVSLFGQMPDMESINIIAERHELTVIEDGAQSFGATRHGRQSGACSTIGTTSFFPAKPLGCYGDGGAIFTNDGDLADKMRAIKSHGGERRHYHPYIGLNGRMDTLHCAVILAKLPHYDEELIARSQAASRYHEFLDDFCTVPMVAKGNSSVYAQYTIRVPDRDAIRAALTEKGIPSAVYYPTCLHQQPVFEKLGCTGDFPESERASREVLSLPMHPFLDEDSQRKVSETLSVALSHQSGV